MLRSSSSPSWSPCSSCSSWSPWSSFAWTGWMLAAIGASPLAAAAHPAPQRPPQAEVDLPATSTREARAGGSSTRFLAQPPVDYEASRWVPVVVLLGSGAGEEAARELMARSGRAIAARGFFVAAPIAGEQTVELGPMLAALRRDVRIEQGGLHAACGGAPARAVAALLAQREEFQTITAFGPVGRAELAPLDRLPARRVQAVAADGGDVLAASLQQLHAQRTLPGVAGECARVLDDFHDAAAVGDEARYFAILPDDAVFLGTDGTERWTGAQFRSEMGKYFARDSAWTYVTLQRHVDVEPGDSIAWFDETFDNAAYGECRGTGVLAKRDGRWVLRQYHLTVPIPNDLAKSIAARIRALQSGAAPAATTTVVIVRHAEKRDASTDTDLSDAGRARAQALARTLRDVPFTAVFSSEFARTAQTVAPVCEARGLQRQTAPGRDANGLAAKLGGLAPGSTALVCGHSNTVPELLRALGVREKVAIGDDEYDRLFVVTLTGDGGAPKVVALRYPDS